MRRRFLGGLVAAAIVSVLPLPRAIAADVYALGATSPGGTVYTLAAAVAGTCNKGKELLRVQPYGTSGQILPLVETGEVSFSLTQVMDLEAATQGTGEFADRRAEHLRAVSFLFPFQVALLVRADLGLERTADIKGRRVADYTTQPTFQVLVRALLANAGLTEQDVEMVPISNFSKQYDDFENGKVDVLVSLPGQPKLADVQQRLGALRLLPIDDSEGAIAAMQQLMPHSYVTEVQPRPNLIGVERPLKMLSYDYVFYANDAVPDAVVAEIAQCLHDNRDALIESTSKFKAFDPAAMAKPLPLPYHPGAEAYYRANGLWPTTP